jgi:hypothetical protein
VLVSRLREYVTPDSLFGLCLRYAAAAWALRFMTAPR